MCEKWRKRTPLRKLRDLISAIQQYRGSRKDCNGVMEVVRLLAKAMSQIEIARR